MVLQISNDFNHSKVHSKLYEELSIQGLAQVIYVPTKMASVIGRNHFGSKEELFVYSKKIKKYHRFFLEVKSIIFLMI